MLKAGSNLERVLAAGHFAVTAEISSPQHAYGELINRHAKLLQGCVDACTLTDNDGAVVQLASMAAGALLRLQGQDAIIQMACRDRNRIALQGDLLGAYALGIRNVLCLSGRHARLGNEPAAKNVYDFDTINLIQTVRQLRDEKRFCGGAKCPAEPRFYIGCFANPCAEPLELHLIQLEKKLDAGADFVQTQAVFDLDRFDEFMAAVRERGLQHRVKFLAGVRLVNSVEAFAGLPGGKNVPEVIRRRMEQAEDQAAAGLAIILEQINHVKNVPGVAGVHIMAPLLEEMLPVIVERSGLLPRPQSTKGD